MWRLIILIGLLVAFVFGFLAGWTWFNLFTGARLTDKLNAYRKTDPALRLKIESQRQQIAHLTASLTGQQNRQILESMGWRPLAAETQPRDGEQILVAGVDTLALSRAPNGAHYANFKKLGNGQVQLTQGAATSVKVELDGTVLWIPQRFLLK